ncbi:MAG: T9SS type A sorting domain-containing protein [Chitinophagales bacterium]
MKRIVLLVILVYISLGSFAQIVTGIKTEYRHGQTFITWNNIPNYSHQFYYVYRYDAAITNSNIALAKYMGRVPFDFSFNYFLNLGLDTTNDNSPRIYYNVINNDPWEVLDSTQGLFVATCNKEQSYYYAVTADSTIILPPYYQQNKRVVPGSNATTVAIQEHIAPINAYLQVSGVALKDNPNLFYEGWAVFGGNVKTQYTPLMAAEACLMFNWGLIKDDAINIPKNSATFFFYGGGGNAYQNANGTSIDRMWKMSMEDDLPNFNWDPLAGENTKWIGYNENFDTYGAGPYSDPPTTGVDRTYTIARVKWNYDWLLRTFPDEIDSTQIAMQGSSNGCTGALTFAYLYPDKVSAVDVTNAKLNIEYLNDDNPTCKWNQNGTSRNRAEIYLGTQLDNLPSDVPKINGPGFYNMYDFANFNILVDDNKYRSLPIIFLTDGKTDNVTCWEEKIPFYKKNQQTKTGSFFYWDLRSHKGGAHQIKDRPLELMQRYRTNLSYPAFSNCSADGDPGDTNNPVEPFYDGDSVGTINGVLDWDDNTIAETALSWETEVHSQQFLLNDGVTLFPAYLPVYVKTDITPRRLQQFVDIPDGSIVHLENWQNNILVQSKIITYHENADGKGLMTFKKAKISKDGNLIKFYVLQGPRESSGADLAVSPLATEMVYPNPTDGIAYVDLSLLKEVNVTVEIRDIMGRRMSLENRGMMAEGNHDFPVNITGFAQGIYVIDIRAGEQLFSYKIIKK